MIAIRFKQPTGSVMSAFTSNRNERVRGYLSVVLYLKQNAELNRHIMEQLYYNKGTEEVVTSIH